ncbi:hypothetical protein D3C79_643980 [compost metagenome]
MPKLIDLEVDRVDLVDEGANSKAHIMLYKRKENTNMSNPTGTLDFDAVVKGLKPEHAVTVHEEINKARSEVPTKTAEELENVKKSLKDAEAIIEQLKADNIAKSKDNDEQDYEEVIKGLDPALQKVFKSMKAEKEAAENIAKQAAEKRLNDTAIAKAATLKNLPIEQDKLVDVVKGISTEVYEVLKAANDAIEKSGVLDEVGTDTPNEEVTKAGSPDQAWEMFEQKVVEIAKDRGINHGEATAIAIKKHRDLYQKSLEGGK